RRAEYEIIGTKGGIKCHNVWAKANETPVISWWTEQGDMNEETLALENHFRLEIEYFIDCVFNQTSPVDFFRDAKNNCKLITATLESITSGQKITL
ncbi:MAG: gfo/Idh/MocA family oxidoreductase, partial [Methylococcales bacterium]|nr:gfo/Idh/MocA family oxidoreductase [Methylococcales bacterium]